MGPQIIGISGSPIKNSNTDRLIQAVLGGSGLKTEFVKLSSINVKPRIGHPGQILQGRGSAGSLGQSRIPGRGHCAQVG